MTSGTPQDVLEADITEEAWRRRFELAGELDADELGLLLRQQDAPRGRAKAAADRRSTRDINRERELERVARENARMCSRLLTTDSAPAFSRNPVFEKMRTKSHSAAVNRARESDRIQRENTKLAERLSKPTQPKAAARSARSGSLPAGW